MSRILARLDELYAIGQHRAGYSAEEDAAHELTSRWLREAGLEVTSDDAGNLFGRRGEARVWSGSHLDSVPTAGRFDGALGVVAAIEAAERLPGSPLAVSPEPMSISGIPKLSGPTPVLRPMVAGSTSASRPF